MWADGRKEDAVAQLIHLINYLGVLLIFGRLVIYNR